MKSEKEIQNTARAIVSFTDSYSYNKQGKQNEQPESKSKLSHTYIASSLKTLSYQILMNRSCKQVIQIPKFLHSLTVLSSFKLGNHSNQEVDLQRFNVRCNSRECLDRIQECGNAKDFADLVNIGYGKVICISFSTAGGIGEEHDKKILNVLNDIINFIRALHNGRNDEWQPSFQPLPLLARRTEEQIEEEGANEEMEAQMNNNGYNRRIKYYAKYAKAVILNHFIITI